MIVIPFKFIAAYSISIIIVFLFRNFIVKLINRNYGSAFCL